MNYISIKLLHRVISLLHYDFKYTWSMKYPFTLCPTWAYNNPSYNYVYQFIILYFRKGKDKTQRKIQEALWTLIFHFIKKNIFHSVFQERFIWEPAGAGNLWRSHLTLSNLKKKMFNKRGNEIYVHSTLIDNISKDKGGKKESLVE